MSNQASQRVRRNGSSPCTTTKHGPMKAVQAFSLKQASSTQRNTGSSPSPRDGHKLWSARKSPDNRLSPERKSPLSNSPNQIKDKCKPHRHTASSGKWRASSVDTVVPSYLGGQWPKDINNYHHYQSAGVFMCDKSTQTVEEWDPKYEKKKSHKRSEKGHRRSASFGQGDQLKLQFIKHQLQKSKEEKGKQRSSPVPANHSALSLTAPPTVFAQQTRTILTSASHTPRHGMNRYQRNSVEGLNTEIEKLVSSVKGISVCTCDYEDVDNVLKEIPDGHRAPVPEVSRLSSTRSVDTQTPSGQLDHALVPSVLAVNRPLSISPASAPTPPARASAEMHLCSRSRSQSTDSKSSKGDADTSPDPSSLLSSPKLEKSCPFVREPPDGCEKVTVVEESRQPLIKEPMLFTPVKPNQFEFKQSQGSAFCPLIKGYLD